MNRDRRAVLAGAASLGGALLAGCSGRTGGSAATETETAGPTLADHPAAAGLDVQPRFGPTPSESEVVIVAFEDPSCPRCKTFERETVPRIREELVDPGRASFVFRGYPVIYDWGEPAVRALEATYAREAGAHWALLDHYFEEQHGYLSAGAEEVLPRTREFLAGNTDLDADAVVTEAADGVYDDAVDADLSAGMDAGAGPVTPHVFLFRDGTYRTKASGSVSYRVVENALGL